MVMAILPDVACIAANVTDMDVAGADDLRGMVNITVYISPPAIGLTISVTNGELSPPMDNSLFPMTVPGAPVIRMPSRYVNTPAAPAGSVSTIAPAVFLPDWSTCTSVGSPG